MRSTLQKVGAVGSIALALVGVAACGSSSKKTASPASSGSAAASGPATAGSAAPAAFVCPSGGIKMGIEPYEDAAKLIPAYMAVGAALKSSLNCDVKISIVESYAAEVLAMKSGKLDIGEFGPLGYVFASNDADAVPVASFANADGTLSSYTGGIWVPKGSAIKTVADLKGHSLALSESGSTSGDAIPRYAIMKAGLSKTDVKTIYAGGHTESLLALTNGKVDAAEVNSQKETAAIADKKFDPSKYTEIYKSDPIPNDPITVWGKEPAGFQEGVAKALLNLTPAQLTEVGKYLDVEPAGPMIAVTKDTYKPLFDLASALHLTSKDA